MGGIVRGDMMESTDVFVPAGNSTNEDVRKAEEEKREHAARKAAEENKSSDKP